MHSKFDASYTCTGTCTTQGIGKTMGAEGIMLKHTNSQGIQVLIPPKQRRRKPRLLPQNSNGIRRKKSEPPSNLANKFTTRANSSFHKSIFTYGNSKITRMKPYFDSKQRKICDLINPSAPPFQRKYKLKNPTDSLREGVYIHSDNATPRVRSIRKKNLATEFHVAETTGIDKSNQVCYCIQIYLASETEGCSCTDTVPETATCLASERAPAT